jgi:hypothetical protein
VAKSPNAALNLASAGSIRMSLYGFLPHHVYRRSVWLERINDQAAVELNVSFIDVRIPARRRILLSDN